MTDTKEQGQAIFGEASAEVQEVAGEVLRLEQEKLYLKVPRGIVEDIADLVKKIVK